MQKMQFLIFITDIGLRGSCNYGRPMEYGDHIYIFTL